MTLTYRYKSIKHPDGKELKSPSIPITLSQKESIDMVALLDSGADISALPKDVAEILGLDLSGEKSTAFGITGSVKAVDSSMFVSVGNAHERYRFRIPVKVILDKCNFNVLLGRAGFFDKFRITFDQKNLKFTLKKNT